MKLTTDRTALANAMSRLANIVDRAQTIQILRNVHLTATGDTLLLRSTNQDIEAVEAIPAQIEIPGVTTVDAGKLATLANSLPSGSTISMSLAETRLTCSSGRTRIQLGILDPAGFPQLWQDEWPTTFEIDAEKLAAMISSVSFAQAQQAARIYLQGIYFHRKDGRLRMVATDSSVLAYCDGPEIAEFEPVTVPSKMVSEMSRLLNSVSGPITVNMSDTKIRLAAGGTVITAKLIDKSLRFPDAYERVLPSDALHCAVVRSAEMVGAINRALIASQNAKDNTVRMAFRSGACAVTARNAEADAFDEIDADYDGPEVEFPLSPAYVLAALSASGDVIEVRFTDGQKATSWAAKGRDDGLIVIMPQRVAK